jgi:predicted transcriptional regulator
VTLQEIKEILDAEVIVGHNRLSLEVTKAGCADMMSDVLVYCTAGSLLVTGLNNSQIVHTANILDLAAIVLVRGKRPFPETIKLAEELQIPILTTKYILFETVVRLHSKGIVSCIEKVGENIS